MATNLISTITQVLSSNLITRIASSLGLDKTVAEKALQAGIPSLLAALTSLVSKPGGVAALNGAIARQEPGVLSNLVSVIGGSAQKSLIDNGASTLTSLLGGTTTSALTNAIGQYAGIGDGDFEEPPGSAWAGRDGRVGTTTAHQWARRYGPCKPSCITER